MDSVTEAAERQAAEELYRQVSERAEALELTQTLRALPFMREKHRNQYRKGTGRVPYMVHPLTMALHALSLGITDDTLLAAVLLHDVVEDTGTDPEELPVSPEARNIVCRLSYNTYPGPKSEILPRIMPVSGMTRGPVSSNAWTGATTCPAWPAHLPGSGFAIACSRRRRKCFRC